MSEKIVSLDKSTGQDMNEGDCSGLIEEYSEELTTDELKELQTHQHMEGFEGNM